MFWHVTLPLLRPYLLVALLLRTIFEFRAFDNVYVMTSGGPANATMLLSMYHLPGIVRAVRPQPRRGGVLDDAADLAGLCACFIAWSAGGTPHVNAPAASSIGWRLSMPP